MSDPNVGFDYRNLPKVSHDEYELPEGRRGWTFQSLGRIAVLVYILAVVLNVITFGLIRTSEVSMQELLATVMIAIGVVPGIVGVAGLFRKPGRWWSLLILLATIFLNPSVLAIIFNLFVSVIVF